LHRAKGVSTAHCRRDCEPGFAGDGGETVGDKDAAGNPMIPRPTMTATTIRMIFRALLFLGAVVNGAAAGADEGVADDTLLPGCSATLGAKFCPPSRVAPQALQNAIVFASRHLFVLTAEYIVRRLKPVNHRGHEVSRRS
jgi:hypothetical protein